MTYIAVVTNAGVSCSVHTWNDNLRHSLPHLNAVVTPETCSVYVALDTCASASDFKLVKSNSIIYFLMQMSSLN